MRYQWWTGGVAVYCPPNIFTLAYSILNIHTLPAPTHYTAFLSYKHADWDSASASGRHFTLILGDLSGLYCFLNGSHFAGTSSRKRLLGIVWTFSSLRKGKIMPQFTIIWYCSSLTLLFSSHQPCFSKGNLEAWCCRCIVIGHYRRSSRDSSLGAGVVIRQLFLLDVQTAAHHRRSPS